MRFCYNPCPCGYFGDPVKECACTPAMASQYQKRISGPLPDRIDNHQAYRSCPEPPTGRGEKRFSRICSLDERSFLHKPFWQRLREARESSAVKGK